MPLAPAVPVLALLAVVLGVVDRDRQRDGLRPARDSRSRPTAGPRRLNLVYLPLYAAGIVGPAIGAALASIGGVAGPFIVGGAVFLVGAVTVYTRIGATTRGARATAEA